MSFYRAFGVKAYGKPRAVLEELQLPVEGLIPHGRDIRVRVMSGALNPVDLKVLTNRGDTTAKLNEPRVPGWDAAGIIDAVGEEVKSFKVGDEVVFAGLVSRSGSFGELVLVDERIVGRKPMSLSWDKAAAFPLTTITAWEGLIEELGIQIPTNQEEEKANSAKTLLVIAGAGGVGSQVIQIAKKVLKIGKVVATASRESTISFCKSLGADLTISHREPLLPQLKSLGLEGAHFIFNCDYPDPYWDQMTAIALPFGRIVNITDSKQSHILSPNGIFSKRVSVHFEMMFARAMHNVEPERQGAILNAAAQLIDNGTLQSTLTKVVPFTRDGLVEGLELLESGSSIGKIAFSVRQHSA